MRRTSPALVLSLLAVVLALGGGDAVADGVAAAKRLVTGKQIKNGSIVNRDLRKGTLEADRLSAQARAALTGAAGPAGPAGAAGIAGPAGPAGPPGPGSDDAVVSGADLDIPQGVGDVEVLAVPGFGSLQAECSLGGQSVGLYWLAEPGGPTSALSSSTLIRGDDFPQLAGGIVDPGDLIELVAAPPSASDERPLQGEVVLARADAVTSISFGALSAVGAQDRCAAWGLATTR